MSSRFLVSIGLSALPRLGRCFLATALTLAAAPTWAAQVSTSGGGTVTAANGSEMFGIGTRSCFGGTTLQPLDARLPGSFDAYDNFWAFALDDVAIDVGPTADLTGSNYTTDPVTQSNGLIARIQYYGIPSHQLFRIMVVLENPTANPVNTVLAMRGQLGSNASTVIETTTNGNSILSSTDRWVVTSDGGPGDAIHTLVGFGPGSVRTNLDAFDINDNTPHCSGTANAGTTELRYSTTTVAPGETVALMLFGGLDDIDGVTNKDIPTAVAQAAQFDDTDSFASKGWLAQLPAGVGTNTIINWIISADTTIFSTIRALDDSEFQFVSEQACFGGQTLTAPEAVAGGSGDAFDGFWGFGLDGAAIVISDQADFQDTTYTTNPVAQANGLEASVQYHGVPTHQLFRTMVVLSNPTASAITTTLQMRGNLGSDTNTQVNGTSSGAATVSAADRWSVTSDSATGTAPNDPAHTLVVYGPDSPRATPDQVRVASDALSCTSSARVDNVDFQFTNITVEPGETVALMFFSGLDDIEGTTNNDNTVAVAQAAQFDDPVAFAGRGWLTNLPAGVTASDTGNIINWVFPRTTLDFTDIPALSGSEFQDVGQHACFGGQTLTADEAIAGGSGDAFDRFWGFGLDGAAIAISDQVDFQGTTYTTNPVAQANGLEASVQYHGVPTHQLFRVMTTLSNPTASPITTTLQMGGNLGSDGSTQVNGTSSGAATVSAADRWSVTSDRATGTAPIDPAHTMVVYGPDNPRATPDQVRVASDALGCGVFADVDNADFQFTNITVEPGETVALMFFSGLDDIEGTTNNDNTVAVAQAAQFDDAGAFAARGWLTELPPGINTTDIINWVLPQVANVGYYELEDGQGEVNQVPPITTAGHTPVLLEDLAAADLAGLDALFVNHQGFGNYGAEYLSRQGDIEAFVLGGGVLLFHDTNLGTSLPPVPGIDDVSFIDEFGEDVNFGDTTTRVSNGPGGTLDDGSLDNATSSHHRAADVTTLPPGAHVILTTENPNEAVLFAYPIGDGYVVYGAIPLSFFLNNSGESPQGRYGEIYAPNAIHYAAGAAQPDAVDSDGDGIPDSWEIIYGLDEDNPGDAGLDVDFDNLSALEEFQAGTSPKDSDSDRDGLSDGIDASPATASNACVGPDASFSDTVPMGQTVQCAADASITVQPGVLFQDGGRLELLAPEVSVPNGTEFSVPQGGELVVDDGLPEPVS